MLREEIAGSMTVRTRTVRTRLVSPGQFVPRTDSPPDNWYP